MQLYSELFLCRRKKLDLTCGTKSPEPRFSLSVLHLAPCVWMVPWPFLKCNNWMAARLKYFLCMASILGPFWLEQLLAYIRLSELLGYLNHNSDTTLGGLRPVQITQWINCFLSLLALSLYWPCIIQKWTFRRSIVEKFRCKVKSCHCHWESSDNLRVMRWGLSPLWKSLRKSKCFN